MKFDLERAFDDAQRQVAQRWKILVSAAVILLMLGAGTFAGLNFLSSNKQNSAIKSSKPTVYASSTAAEKIRVHISGYVKHPGVIEVPSQAIVEDVIKAVGGFLSEADLHGQNLAREVKNGEHIIITRKKDDSKDSDTAPVFSGDKGSSGDKININTATAEQLTTLPKVGPHLAEKIIQHRKNKPILALEDLDAVPGVGPKMLENLKALVSF